MFSITKRLAAVVIAVGLSGVAASASDYAAYRKVVTYQTVTTYVLKEVPYEKVVTKYDHCGKPYTAVVAGTKTVEVPVTKTVAVVKYVKVCDYRAAASEIRRIAWGGLPGVVSTPLPPVPSRPHGRRQNLEFSGNILPGSSLSPSCPADAGTSTPLGRSPMIKKATNVIGFVAAVIGLVGAVQGLDLSNFISRDRSRQETKPAGITWQHPDVRKTGACEPTYPARPPQITKAPGGCHWRYRDVEVSP